MTKKKEIADRERGVLTYLAGFKRRTWQNGDAVALAVRMPREEAFDLMRGLYERGLIDYIPRPGLAPIVRILDEGRIAL